MVPGEAQKVVAEFRVIAFVRQQPRPLVTHDGWKIGMLRGQHRQALGLGLGDHGRRAPFGVSVASHPAGLDEQVRSG